MRRAELYFGEDKIIECINLYDSVFNKTHNPFPEDVFLAAQVSNYYKKHEYTYKFLLKAISEGLSLESVFKFEKFEDFLKTEYGEKLKNNYDMLYRSLYDSKDTILNKMFIKLLKKDLKNNEITYKLWAKIFPKVALKKFNEINKSVSDSVLKLIKKHGYLGVKSIGIRLNFNSNRNAIIELSSHTLTAIIYHNAYLVDSLGEELNKALVDGEIHPRHFAMIYDFYQKSLLERGLVKKYNFKYPFEYVFHTKTNDKVLVNERRLAIGVHSKEDMRMLILKYRDKEIYPFYSPFN